METCPKCGAERFEGRHITFHCGSYCTPKGTWEHSGECNARAKVNELEARVAEIEEALTQIVSAPRPYYKIYKIARKALDRKAVGGE